MSLRLAALILAAGTAWSGPKEFSLPSEDAKAYKRMPSGHYAVKVIGMLTTTCGRGIEIETMRLPEVESAKVDFDKETMFLTVRINHTLRLPTLRKALHLASDRVNLGVDYFVGRITFIP
ncbi:MAG: hypothetical protein HY926_02235 [Elusimicrobia bacterium]|nr:hypothetical protein [Elusimicrobiota bacterium]